MAQRIDPASARDLDEVLGLLRDAELPTDGVREHLRTFLVARSADGLLGCVGLEDYGDSGLLRSLAVRPSGRGRGTGNALVEALVERARERGLESLYLLTTTAERYFPRFGFVSLPRTEAPEALHQSEELRGACPDSAVFMKLLL